MPEHVLEVVTFSILSGTDEAAFLNAAGEAGGVLKNMPGFVSRRLARTDDEWMDIVEWTDAASAAEAAKVFHTIPAAQPFCGMIDMGTARMAHYALAAAA